MIICCGQACCGDDAAGIEVGLGLRALGLEVTILERDPFELLDVWTGHDDVVLVDAAVSGFEPGTVTVWKMDGEQQFERARILSIHSAGTAEAIALAAALGRLPRQVVLYGIEPGSTKPFAGISDAVRNSIDNLTEELATARYRDATSPAQWRLDDALRRLGGAVSVISPGELKKNFSKAIAAW